MTEYALTILAPHMDKLKKHLFQSDLRERAAYILLGTNEISADPWDQKARTKYVTHEVIPVHDDDVISHDAMHITWSTQSFVRALKKAKDQRMTLGVIHSHTGGYAGFSKQDDANEPDLVQLTQNRNGTDADLVSVVMTPDEQIFGRVWHNVSNNTDMSYIHILGDRFALHYPKRNQCFDRDIFNRQALAFGQALTQDMSKLRIGVVGCGGTGSALLTLLHRIGIGHLALFDADIVELSNLNRLHGATVEDAANKAFKVDVAKREIERTGLPIKVLAFPHWIDHQACQIPLKSCDLIFGCTDDNDGRILLNLISHHYGIPVIDMGLAIEVSDEDIPRMIACDGRVTMIMPGLPCLQCRGVINPLLAREEEIKRNDPQEYQRLKAEAYVAGEGNPAPVVATFTTETATMSVNELLHRYQGFRGTDGHSNHRVRKFHYETEDRMPGVKVNDKCPVCGQTKSWGRADDTRFLGMMERVK